MDGYLSKPTPLASTGAMLEQHLHTSTHEHTSGMA